MHQSTQKLCILNLLVFIVQKITLIQSPRPNKTLNNKICDIDVQDTNGNTVKLALCEGVNLMKCLQMQSKWTASFAAQLEQLQNQNPEVELIDLLKKGDFQDAHWKWAEKCLALSTEDYIWFSLESSNDVETAIVIKHPHDSRFNSDAIYYIDYLAIAPWNRQNSISNRKFKGLGPMLMKEAGKYLNVQLKYREGFSLHSLPQASAFYTKIGMIDFGPDVTKQNLNYFEMKQIDAVGFING